jgi:Tfp pilus assembly protein PilP
VSNADVFVARDPFRPMIEPTKTVEPSTTATETVPKDTIVLHQIVSSNGEYKAVLSWNETTYTAGEGETLGKTPWKVISVSEDSCVLLYGDVRVTLTVGEGMSK